MIEIISIHFDPNEFSKDSALYFAREGLRQKQDKNTVPLLSVNPKHRDVIVEISDSEITVGKAKSGENL